MGYGYLWMRAVWFMDKQGTNIQNMGIFLLDDVYCGHQKTS